MGSHPPTAKTGLISFDTILTVLERLVRLALARGSQNALGTVASLVERIVAQGN
jgi:hypothetical protein